MPSNRRHARQFAAEHVAHGRRVRHDGVPRDRRRGSPVHAAHEGRVVLIELAHHSGAGARHPDVTDGVDLGTAARPIGCVLLWCQGLGIATYCLLQKRLVRDNMLQQS